jgi:hypothetical protein
VSPGSSGSSTPTADPGDGPTPNILVYAARFNSGLPFQGPVTVQLREYLAGSRWVIFLMDLSLTVRVVGVPCLCSPHCNNWEADFHRACNYATQGVPRRQQVERALLRAL